MSFSRPRSLIITTNLWGILPIILIIAAFALTPRFAMAKSGENDHGKKNGHSKKVTLSKSAKFEIDLLKKSIDRQARILAKMKNVDALTTNTDVLALVNLFVARETEEMTTMTGWLSSWYQITYVPKMKLPKTEIDDDDDEDSDAQIIEPLIGYDYSEIALARQALRKGNHAEFKKFSAQVILTNKAEILQLKELIAMLEGDDDPEDIEP